MVALISELMKPHKEDSAEEVALKIRLWNIRAMMGFMGLHELDLQCIILELQDIDKRRMRLKGEST